MNIDLDIANRALEKAGQETLTDTDIEQDSVKWRLIKNNYLQTILETLSNTEWTSRKKRAKLEKSEEENYTNYSYMYKLPIDCAKPEALLDNSEYIIENTNLYTDTDNAILMYIANGRRESNDIIETEDYPEYDNIEFDPLLSEYIETRLASKIVLKITGNENLYQLLYGEAQLMERRAVRATYDHSKSKTQGNVWWEEELGITRGKSYVDN